MKENWLTSRDRFLEILDSSLLAGEAVALLVVQPAELLKHLGMVGVALKDFLVCSLCAVIIFLLFMYMANLEPDILLGQRMGRRVYNVFEALGRLLESEAGRDKYGYIPRDSGYTFAAACRLYPDGSRSHSPSRSQAAFA